MVFLNYFDVINTFFSYELNRNVSFNFNLSTIFLGGVIDQDMKTGDRSELINLNV